MHEMSEANEVDMSRLVKIRDWLTRRIEEERDEQTTLSILDRKVEKISLHAASKERRDWYI